MSTINKLLTGLALATVMISSCKKDENKVFYEGGTAPVLTASATATIPLSFANSEKDAIKLSWTNPEYQFNTGISSQNVTYLIEIDTVGANFTNPNKQTIAVSNDLSKTLTQSQLNDYLLNQLVLVPAMEHNIEMRVKSNLTNNSALLISNALQFKVTPYAIPPKVAPPASGKLYITGSATPASWQCGCPADVAPASQTFTQVSPTLYELPNITLTGGGSYLFLPVYGSWSAKYGFNGSNNENNVNGDDFKAEGGDMKAPDATGNYKIVVDFQRGKFTVTKL
ncbi:MAG TPA: SusE domain-containing protein [Chitinophagaceae bacterium]|nr:SusE domain-containing protein [Chitinophagaceae bacterium]